MNKKALFSPFAWTKFYSEEESKELHYSLVLSFFSCSLSCLFLVSSSSPSCSHSVFFFYLQHLFLCLYLFISSIGILLFFTPLLSCNAILLPWTTWRRRKFVSARDRLNAVKKPSKRKKGNWDTKRIRKRRYCKTQNVFCYVLSLSPSLFLSRVH